MRWDATVATEHADSRPPGCQHVNQPPGAGVSGAQVIKVRDPEQGDGRSLVMPTQSSHPPSAPKQQPRRTPLPIGERRDAKQESAFYSGVASVRRSLAQELIADRKR